MLLGAMSSGASRSSGRAAPARVDVVPSTEESPYQYAKDPSGIETVAVPIAGSKLVRGRSTVTVAAPLATVRSKIMAFSRYPEFMPHYSACRVLGKSPSGGRDVYMEVSALHGAVTMWARMDVHRPVVGPEGERIDSKLLDGNVKELRATWRLTRIDDTHTQLSLEVFLEPSLPLPSSILNGENLKGSADGLLAMKKRSEA